MYHCTNCGKLIDVIKEHQKYWHKKTGKIFCEKKCGWEYRSKNGKKVKPKIETLNCSVCGKEIEVSGQKLSYYKKTNRVYCSKTCSKIFCSAVSSKTMARTNRRYASARMKKNNPMYKEESREKMKASLKRIQHSPKIRGGNGKPPTEAELKLFDIFGGIGFHLQCIVKTGHYRDGSGFPAHYKIDCGNPVLKIGIETDGASHCSLKRKAQDQKKDAFLIGLGWRVFRFTNQEIFQNINEIMITIMSTISKLKTQTPTL